MEMKNGSPGSAAVESVLGISGARVLPAKRGCGQWEVGGPGGTTNSKPPNLVSGRCMESFHARIRVTAELTELKGADRVPYFTARYKMHLERGVNLTC